MKLLSFAIPCYNSESYMEKCIESILIGGEDVEILIINDGSKDRTAEIADAYQAKYPTICRAIHQENGGHGEAVNAGIRNATGRYFKVVDSDDWVNPEAYMAILDKLREYDSDEHCLDVLLSNYVYEKEGALIKQVMRQSGVPKNKEFSWDDRLFFLKGQYILMHSVIYRTAMIRECGLELPKHTFYVDSIYVFNPLPSVKKMYYMDVDFYRYFIGRDDQSVNETVMIRRIDQQMKVNRLLVEKFTSWTIENKQLYRYLYNYVEIITAVSCVMCMIDGSDELLQKRVDLWNFIRQTDEKLYKKLRYGVFGLTFNIPGKIGRKFGTFMYRMGQKVVGFN